MLVRSIFEAFILSNTSSLQVDQDHRNYNTELPLEHLFIGEMWAVGWVEPANRQSKQISNWFSIALYNSNNISPFYI